MITTLYATLDDALADVAHRSFCEDCTVIPVEGGWTVEDSHNHQTDEWVWTYEAGAHDADSVSEVSRLHEPYESYETAGHVRYNMSDSVELLEARTHAVAFTYAAVDAADCEDHPGNVDPETGDWCQCDRLVGWILVAEHYEV